MLKRGTRSFLYTVGESNVFMCDCQNEMQTPEHLIFNCNLVSQVARQNLVEALPNQELRHIYAKRDALVCCKHTQVVKDIIGKNIL